MSPNEFQLRAALRDGEGESLDVDGVIARAADLRRDRRRRVNTVLGGVAAAAVVGVCAAGVVALGSGGRTAGTADSAGSSALAGGAVAAGSSAAGAARGPSVRGAPSTGSSSAPADAPTGEGCPTTADRYSLPGGGGLGRFGSTEPLFAEPVTSIRVCSYPARPSYVPGVTTLTGAAAQSIVAQLEAAPSRRTNAACPANTDAMGGTLEIIGVAATGRELPGVVLTLGCPNGQATNGTAVRYPITVPPELLGMLASGAARSTAARSTAARSSAGSTPTR